MRPPPPRWFYTTCVECTPEMGVNHDLFMQSLKVPVVVQPTESLPF
jgi:hypothetical protein